MFLGEQGRSRISFGTGLSPGLKILLSGEDKGKAEITVSATAMRFKTFAL